MRCWCGCLSAAVFRLFAYGPANVGLAYSGCLGKEAIKWGVVVICSTFSEIFVIDVCAFTACVSRRASSL